MKILTILFILFGLFCQGQTNSIVTEHFLEVNFTPKSGVTPGADDLLGMSCDQILARYKVSITGVTSIGNRLPGQNQIVADVSVSVKDIDYVILTYEWTADEGKDLDTKTEILNSSYSDIDQIAVGWYTPLSVAAEDPRDSIMMWGGDNQTSGQETVFINILKLKGLDSIPDNINGDMYASWYVAKLTGNCRIKVDAYLGGTISKSGTVFTCSGTKVLDGQYMNITNVNANFGIGGDVADANFAALYSKIAFFGYDKTSNTFTMAKY